MTNQIAVFIDFENVALWAEHEFIDFELTPLLEYLQSRGPVVIKRAYGDWSRFTNYRDELMNNAIDLIQIYSVRAGKNRADIRMAMDALEVVMTRAHIDTFVIVSGDSDFGPLVTKLREYGRYTIGIGPRNITHSLLVKSCDEFTYLETVLGAVAETDEHTPTDRETTRTLLLKAVQAHGQRGEIPVLASRLRQTMLLMDSAFNEAHLGHAQFRDWLEENRDLIKLYGKDLQLFVAPRDYVAPGLDLKPVDLTPAAPAPTLELPLGVQYRQLFTRLKLTAVDMTTRRDVLRDLFRKLSEHPADYTADELLNELHARYEAQGLLRNMPTLLHIWQMGLSQRAFDLGGQSGSQAKVKLAPEIDSESALVRRAESGFVYAVVYAGLELEQAELAAILINDRQQADYIQSLADDLEERNQIKRVNGRYSLPGQGAIPFAEDVNLQVIIRDIEQTNLSESLSEGGAEKARALVKTAMVQRSQDFAASARSYLAACRLQWDAVAHSAPGATLDDLRWYMASYASVRAGQISQVQHNYAGARLYYLAFFSLVQEDDPLWSRMRGLINPMLTYFWINVGRELNTNVVPGGALSAASPAQIALLMALHPKDELRQRWQTVTETLARVNPGLVRRVANQLRLNQSASPDYAQVAEQLEKMTEG